MSDKEESVPKKSSLNPKTPNIQYHLLLNGSNCCNNQSLNMDKASLYLAPSAFSFPVSTQVSPKLSKTVMAYLTDSSGMLESLSKGLRSVVKDYIGIMSNIIPAWKFRIKSTWNKYVLKRYVILFFIFF